MAFDALTIVGIVAAIGSAALVIRACITKGCGKNRVSCFPEEQF
jgi:hypothetical protein